MHQQGRLRSQGAELATAWEGLQRATMRAAVAEADTAEGNGRLGAMGTLADALRAEKDALAREVTALQTRLNNGELRIDEACRAAADATR